MRILVTEVTDQTGRFVVTDADPPLVGCKYKLEDAENPTNRQNKAFHSLLDVYWRSGAWSYEGSGYRPGMTYTEFRDHIKRYLGAGFEAYFVAEIVDGKVRVDVYDEWAKVPKHVRDDPNKGEYCRGRLKSYGDYTKKERRTLLDKLISEMHQTNVTDPAFERILKGMEDASKEKTK